MYFWDMQYYRISTKSGLLNDLCVSNSLLMDVWNHIFKPSVALRLKSIVAPLLFLIFFSCQPANTQTKEAQAPSIIVGAERIESYLHYLKGKKVGLFVNHTSMMGAAHLTDTLIAHGINIQTVFSPEHGFLGNKPDGEKIENERSNKFELVSLYGKSRKPSPTHIEELDILLVDIQDVGVRCYTYASTMTYLMEACARQDVPVLILDRPNPNDYVAGSMMATKHQSFLGLHPIPLVHGLTLGELAKMINGEKWLGDSLQCDLTVIPCEGWQHGEPYPLQVAPSPNLPNDLAISLYPSLVLLEQTVVSVGRGTDFPFQLIGHPLFSQGDYQFTPMPNSASKYPPLEGELCQGILLKDMQPNYALNLQYLITFYHDLSPKLQGSFFGKYFAKISGTDSLEYWIKADLPANEMTHRWASELAEYKSMRKRYLIYPL